MANSTHPATDLDIVNVIKRFGSHAAVDDVTFSVAPGEFFSILGPSGCGKTTLMRMIAGFEHLDLRRYPHPRPVDDPGRSGEQAARSTWCSRASALFPHDERRARTWPMGLHLLAASRVGGRGARGRMRSGGRQAGKVLADPRRVTALSGGQRPARGHRPLLSCFEPTPSCSSTSRSARSISSCASI